MRFVYHHRTQGRGAEGVHVAQMVRALRADGHEVVVVSPPGVDPLKTAGAAPVDKAATREHGVHRLWQAMSRKLPQVLFEIAELAYNAFALVRLLPVLRDPSTVLYERYAFFLTAGVMTAKWRGVPVILEVNEVAGIPRARKQFMVGLSRWIERRVFARADRILTVSSFLKNEIVAQGAHPEKVIVLPNAVDASWLDMKTCPAAIRHRHGLDNATVLGFVGWFDTWDRLEILVDVLKDLRETRPDLRLLLVGDGPVATTVKSRARELQIEDEVCLTGAVARSDIPSYIDAMDICVLPDSNPFGSPIVLFEFMAMGKPVIAPDVLPVRDVVDNLRNGLVVRAGDSGELKGAISALLENRELRDRVGQEARRSVTEKHTWNSNASVVASTARQIASPTR